MNDTKKYLEQYGAKIQESISFLGSNWILHKESTYNSGRRNPIGFCDTLRHIAANAVREGRL